MQNASHVNVVGKPNIVGLIMTKHGFSLPVAVRHLDSKEYENTASN